MHIHKCTCIHIPVHMHTHLPFTLVNTVQCKTLTYCTHSYLEPLPGFSSQEKAWRCFPFGHSEGPGSFCGFIIFYHVDRPQPVSLATTHGVGVVSSALQYKRCCEQPRSL